MLAPGALPGALQHELLAAFASAPRWAVSARSEDRDRWRLEPAGLVGVMAEWLLLPGVAKDDPLLALAQHRLAHHHDAFAPAQQHHHHHHAHGVLRALYGRDLAGASERTLGGLRDAVLVFLHHSLRLLRPPTTIAPETASALLRILSLGYGR